MREEQSNMSKLFSPFGTRTEQYVKVKRGNELFFFILHFFERNKVKHVFFFLEINYYRVGSSRGNSWHRGFFLKVQILGFKLNSTSNWTWDNHFDQVLVKHLVKQLVTIGRGVNFTLYWPVNRYWNTFVSYRSKYRTRPDIAANIGHIKPENKNRLVQKIEKK